MKRILLGISLLAMVACNDLDKKYTVSIYETSASGNKLTEITDRIDNETVAGNGVSIVLHPETTYQTILGFGGAFTESSAYLLNRLSDENRKFILDAYFGEEGANYSLTRTHINSCDFSLTNYSYANVEGDTALEHFSIDEDRDDIIPMIKDAMEVSEDGFLILASPWTAPPWMKDNNSWKGGKLLPEYRESWALLFSKYLSAYKQEGINIWGITVENEPLGNDSNWESMHFTPEETVEFTNLFLGPRLEKDGHDVKILAYDQNRGDELNKWADVMFRDEESSKYIDGTAVHWYASTYEWFPENLEYAHNAAPDKLLVHTESCVDAEVPHWKEDDWYWKKEATDWGWDWASGDDRKYHPKYVPVYRYARDIIGCLNSWVEGWIDWNMVLDRQGGPNWAKNWAVAPIIVDPDTDEVYLTPLYYTMVHFSKYIRPGAVRIGMDNSDDKLMSTAVKNPDGSIAVVVLNMENEAKGITLELENKSLDFALKGQALQTIIIE